MSNFYNMNHSDAATSRGAESAPRFKNFENPNPFLSYPNYPFGIMPNHLLINPNTIPMGQISDQGTLDSYSSGITSPAISDHLKPNYVVDYWSNIAPKYEGNSDERPNCGRLKNDTFFTHRSGDAYYLFEKKSDYINHFVNYYFSDRNLQKDMKLKALMDDKGVVPLSALIMFPKLNHVETTVEDVTHALQNNSLLAVVDLAGGEKGVWRRDRSGGNSDLVSLGGGRNGQLHGKPGDLSSSGDGQHQPQYAMQQQQQVIPDPATAHMLTSSGLSPTFVILPLSAAAGGASSVQPTVTGAAMQYPPYTFMSFNGHHHHHGTGLMAPHHYSQQQHQQPPQQHHHHQQQPPQQPSPGAAAATGFIPMSLVHHNYTADHAAAAAASHFGFFQQASFTHPLTYGQPAAAAAAAAVAASTLNGANHRGLPAQVSVSQPTTMSAATAPALLDSVPATVAVAPSTATAPTAVAPTR